MPETVALSDGTPAFDATVTAPDIGSCMPSISPRLAQAIPYPNTENSEPYAEQPRHHTVMRAVQKAVSRASGERKWGISGEDSCAVWRLHKSVEHYAGCWRRPRSRV